jgi:hypothetical protein
MASSYLMVEAYRVVQHLAVMVVTNNARGERIPPVCDFNHMPVRCRPRGTSFSRKATGDRQCIMATVT